MTRTDVTAHGPRPRRRACLGTSAVTVALTMTLVAACGDGPPTSPSKVPTASLASNSTLRQSATTIGAFATAPGTATLKVTAPLSQSPPDGSVLNGTHAVLAASGPLGQFIEAIGLRLGFAVWEVAGDGGGTTLIEAGDVPRGPAGNPLLSRQHH